MIKKLAVCVVCLLLATGLAVLAQTASTKVEKKTVIVELKTSKGDLTLELWPDVAATTVDNFLRYVASGHYDGTVFHRVVKGFVIQGGGYDEKLQEKPTMPPIRLEAKEHNRKYTIAMARTSDPNSATAQFFINLADNGGLDPDQRPPGYAVFGKVIKGVGVVDQIGALPVQRYGPFDTYPVTPVMIHKAVIAK